MMYDTLIRNALIIDGSNRPGYPADVAILNGRIERIGDLHDAPPPKKSTLLVACWRRVSSTSTPMTTP